MQGVRPISPRPKLPTLDRIYLTGFMGTGKSAVGPLAARSLGYEFVDLDKVIEKAAHSTIPDIFKTEGEEGFRQRETDALMAVSRKNRVVVATGGGAVIRPENRKCMAESGHVICLTASPTAIVRRTRKKRARRPVLGTEGDLAARIEELMSERAPFYGECHHMVDTTKRPVESVAREVVQLHREGAWKK